MITRSDIIWLGVSSGVTGGLVGGLMLGVGLAMMIEHINIGLLLIIPGAPASGLIGCRPHPRAPPAGAPPPSPPPPPPPRGPPAPTTCRSPAAPPHRVVSSRCAGCRPGRHRRPTSRSPSTTRGCCPRPACRWCGSTTRSSWSASCANAGCPPCGGAGPPRSSSAPSRRGLPPACWGSAPAPSLLTACRRRWSPPSRRPCPLPRTPSSPARRIAACVR